MLDISDSLAKYVLFYSQNDVRRNSSGFSDPSFGKVTQPAQTGGSASGRKKTASVGGFTPQIPNKPVFPKNRTEYVNGTACVIAGPTSTQRWEATGQPAPEGYSLTTPPQQVGRSRDFIPPTPATPAPGRMQKYHPLEMVRDPPKRKAISFSENPKRSSSVGASPVLGDVTNLSSKAACLEQNDGPSAEFFKDQEYEANRKLQVIAAAVSEDSQEKFLNEIPDEVMNRAYEGTESESQ